MASSGHDEDSAGLWSLHLQQGERFYGCQDQGPGGQGRGPTASSVSHLSELQVRSQTILDHWEAKKSFLNVDFSIEMNALCATYEGPATGGEISYIFCSDYLTGKIYKKINFL